ERLYLKALKASEHHIKVGARGRALIHLAQLYRRLGRLAEAEPLVKQALAIIGQALGPEHPLIAQSLHQLALIYHGQGRLSEAIPLEEQALEIRKKWAGPAHSEVASCMNDLANYYWELGQYAQAESLQTSALTIMEEALGSLHPWVGGTMTDLARIYVSQHRYDEAGPLYQRALSILDEALGPDHPEVADGHNNLAVLLTKLDKYTEAESHFQKALTIRQKVLGNDHHLVAESLEGYSTLQRCQKSYAEALESADRAVGIRHLNFTENSSALSEPDALVYSDLMRRSTDNLLSCYLDIEASTPTTEVRVADAVISTKGQVSDAIFERQKNLVTETDSATIDLALKLKQSKHQLAELYVRGTVGDPAGFRLRTDSLTTATRDLEAELSRRSLSYRRRQESRDISVERLVSQLPDQAVLVEYLKYNLTEPQKDSTTAHYLAVVFDGTGVVNLIDMGEASQTDKLIDQYRQHMVLATQTAGLPSGDDLARYRTIAVQLWARIWQPIEAYTRDKELIMIAPDGGLSLVSFAGLIDEQGQYLVEKSTVHYLSAGRDLIPLQHRDKPASGLFAIGAPDFDASIAQRLAGLGPRGDSGKIGTGYYGLRGSVPTCSEFMWSGVSSLPLSQYEVEAIANSWRGASEERVTAYFGAQASEDRFKAMAPRHRVIHLATHGYFISAACHTDRINGSTGSYVGDHPLLLSGLFLAGANLRGGGTDSTDVEDGILTAYELSSMDLTGTQLVVLSACETGLGSVQEGEGVYGLRRAFQMAGARTVISSLWAVSDRQTATFMTRLYEAGDESIPFKLRQLQLSALSDLRSKGLSDHPVSWGPFIASGDWK
ncbi:MAG: CHAT domain-containing protein, partial [candidate division Zixibacteria bacterium]|nr:CHAT domain-containing protein [candidate division Zixibacteria bacterium]